MLDDVAVVVGKVGLVGKYTVERRKKFSLIHELCPKLCFYISNPADGP